MKKFKLPKITKKAKGKSTGFPLPHYSYSSFVKFSTNPIMFKINYINGDRIESTRNISGVVGNAFHEAMDSYYSNEGIKQSLQDGMDYIEGYSDGFIEYSTSIPNKAKAQEKLAFAFNSYIKEKADEEDDIIAIEEMLEETISVEWKGKKLDLPVKLKGYIDKITRDKKGRLKIIDYKTAQRFSDPDKIDGSKILQAVQYYLLVYAKYKEAPYSMTFEEIKLTQNRDGSPQLKEYEIIFAENEMFFDFYFRMYEDVTKAINGEAVFVPNIYTFFDNEVSMVAYIHRLDQEEEKAKAMQEEQITNITDLLKKKIQKASSVKQFLKLAEKKFVSFKSLNYSKMQNNEKIKTKLMELGKIVDFEDKIKGTSVTLYRFTPSIGLRMKSLERDTADIEQVLGISGVRVLAPIPNSSMIGFEVPNKERLFVDMPETPGRIDKLDLGVDIMNRSFFYDLREAPHLLVAGASGSGKSVFLNSIISQLTQHPDEVELHLYDPKRVELIQFKSNAKSYQSEASSIALELMDLVDEMEKRYKYMEKNCLRKIDGQLPYKVIVLDEFGDLTIGSDYGKDIMHNITILAQKARAAGMHIILATQRPDIKVITGTIKNNFPTKVAFRMAKAIDSQVVGVPGAEKLLGKGDMIFSSDSGDVRLQGYNF